MDLNHTPDPGLLDQFERLGARMLAEAPPVSTAEAVAPYHPLHDPLWRPHVVDTPLIPSSRLIGADPSPGRHRGVLIGAVAAASLLVVGLGVVARSGDDDPQAVGSSVTTAAAADTVSEAAPSSAAAAPSATDAVVPVPTNGEIAWPPRVLLDDTWAVVTASERSVDEGYISFQRDGVIVHVGWYRGPGVGPEYDPGDGTAVGSATLLGHDVTTYSSAVSYRAGDVSALVDEGVVTDERIVGDAAASDDPDELIGGPILDEALADAIADGLIEGVPTQGLLTGVVQNASSLSVQVITADPALTLTQSEFAEMLAGVRQVVPPDWEAAMPDRVVTPNMREAVVAELMTDVPVTEDWSPTTPDADAALTQDRTDVAGSLAASVSCAWIRQYFTADAESAAATEALDAIATIPNWPATQELTASWDSEEPGVIPTPNNGAAGVTVEGDVLMYNDEPLDGFFAAQLCDMNAAG